MAEEKDTKRSNSRVPNTNDAVQMNTALNKGLAKKLQNNIDDIYRSTYFSDNDNDKYLSSIRRKMDTELNDLMDRIKNSNGGVNISDLYARTLASSDDNSMKELRKTLEDDSLLTDIMDIYSQNVIVRDMDKEIDTVCKYMPKLEEALDIKADNVLSADHFNDDATHITKITNNTNSDDTAVNKDRGQMDMDSFIKKYDLKNFKQRLYKKTAKYGEQFVYIISYNKALGRLTEREIDGQVVTESALLEEVDTLESSLDRVQFGFNIEKDNYQFSELNESGMPIEDMVDRNSEKYNNVEVEFNQTGVIPSIIREQLNIRRVIRETTEPILERDQGLGYTKKTYLSSMVFAKNNEKRYKKALDQGGELIPPTSLTMDGLKDPDEDKRKRYENTPIDIPGCIVELLEHSLVKPLYINNMCLGYYYVESNTPMSYEDQMTFTSTLGGLRPRRTARENQNMSVDQTDSQVLMKIAKQISDRIDKKFINANQDLAQEIYTILKYNADHGGSNTTKIRITFIPPQDIEHVYFEFDEKKKRGVSDLHRSLFTAKLYSCIYISNVIALLTRGYDKRIYHVRQAVDQNITSVLMTVINQIKRSNFNLRQIENMNNILNITGRFNDMVIPQNANGESPISFEVMPGQNIDVKNEFMQMLEEMAVNQTGVSLEMVNSRYQEQTATHLTQTNARFLIKVYGRQKQYEELLSKIYTKIYNYEYGNSDVLKVELPPPIMLNFQNTSQILAVANEVIQNIVLMKMPTEQNEMIKTNFSGKLMEYYLKTCLPMDDINKLYDEAMMDYKSQLPLQDPNSMGGGMDMNGGDMGGGM